MVRQIRVLSSFLLLLVAGCPSGGLYFGDAKALRERIITRAIQDAAQEQCHADPLSQPQAVVVDGALVVGWCGSVSAMPLEALAGPIREQMMRGIAGAAAKAGASQMTITLQPAGAQ